MPREFGGSLSITQLLRANVIFPVFPASVRECGIGRPREMRYGPRSSRVRRRAGGTGRDGAEGGQDRARLEGLVGCGAQCGLYPRTLGAMRGVGLGSDHRICIFEALTLGL